MWPLLRRISASLRHREWLEKVNAREAELADLTSDALRQTSSTLRYRAKCREPRDELLPAAFALVREASKRTTGLRHRDEQMIAGMVMADGGVAHMEAGEGKSLAAVLPLYLGALSGEGAHLIVLTDELARRDAERIRATFGVLGLSVGVVQSDLTATPRRDAYRCDATYGKASEFALDFLRKELSRQHDAGAPDDGRPRLTFALCDDADRTLIDEADTPLIISSPASKLEKRAVAYVRICAEAVSAFQPPMHFVLDRRHRTATLTDRGTALARAHFSSRTIAHGNLQELYQFMEQALAAHAFYTRGRDYEVNDWRILVLDSNTGEPSPLRRFHRGIHQALEAREGLEITPEPHPAARITLHSYLRLYPFLCGVSASAWPARQALRSLYQLSTARIAARHPSRRTAWPAFLAGNEQEPVRTAQERIEKQGLKRRKHAVQQREQWNRHCRRMGLNPFVDFLA